MDWPYSTSTVQFTLHPAMSIHPRVDVLCGHMYIIMCARPQYYDNSSHNNTSWRSNAKMIQHVLGPLIFLSSSASMFASHYGVALHHNENPAHSEEKFVQSHQIKHLNVCSSRDGHAVERGLLPRQRVCVKGI